MLNCDITFRVGYIYGILSCTLQCTVCTPFIPALSLFFGLFSFPLFLSPFWHSALSLSLHIVVESLPPPPLPFSLSSERTSGAGGGKSVAAVVTGGRK